MQWDWCTDWDISETYLNFLTGNWSPFLMPSVIWLKPSELRYCLWVDPGYKKTFRMESSPECSLVNMSACIWNLKYDVCNLKCDLYLLCLQFPTPSCCSGKGKQKSNIWLWRVSMGVKWGVWLLNHYICSKSWETSCVEDSWFSEGSFWAFD